MVLPGLVKTVGGITEIEKSHEAVAVKCVSRSPLHVRSTSSGDNDDFCGGLGSYSLSVFSCAIKARKSEMTPG